MAEFRATPGLEKWFLVSILVAYLPHLTHVPVWAFAGALLLTSWRFYLRFKHLSLPSKGFRYLLAGTILIAVILTYRAFLGRDPGMTALILLSSLKLLESEKPRDYQFVLYIGYFLVLGNFLYSQTIPALVFMVVSVLVISGNMILLHQAPAPRVVVLPLLRQSFNIFLKSLPFAVFLFFVFPSWT